MMRAGEVVMLDIIRNGHSMAIRATLRVRTPPMRTAAPA
jgi:hypothetical protein